LQPGAKNFLEEFARRDKELEKLKKIHNRTNCYLINHVYSSNDLIRNSPMKDSGLNKHYLEALKKNISTLDSGVVQANAYHSETSSLDLKRINVENIIKQKLHELQSLKDEQVKRLGKYFGSMPLTLRKTLLPKVVAALFGESAYEIEILKQAQLFRTLNQP